MLKKEMLFNSKLLRILNISSLSQYSLVVIRPSSALIIFCKHYRKLSKLKYYYLNLFFVEKLEILRDNKQQNNSNFITNIRTNSPR